MHIYLADQVTQQLDRGYIFDHLGSYYLGSTAPDIRAMTRWPREQTHFAPLSVEEVGTGARTMFRMHPELQADFVQMPRQLHMPAASMSDHSLLMNAVNPKNPL